MQSIEYEVSDVDFLIERFAALTEKQVYELPSEFAERVRYLSADLVLRLIIPCKKLCL